MSDTTSWLIFVASYRPGPDVQYADEAPSNLWMDSFVIKTTNREKLEISPVTTSLTAMKHHYGGIYTARQGCTQRVCKSRYEHMMMSSDELELGSRQKVGGISLAPPFLRVV